MKLYINVDNVPDIIEYLESQEFVYNDVVGMDEKGVFIDIDETYAFAIAFIQEFK